MSHDMLRSLFLTQLGWNTAIAFSYRINSSTVVIYDGGKCADPPYEETGDHAIRRHEQVCLEWPKHVLSAREHGLQD